MELKRKLYLEVIKKIPFIQDVTAQSMVDALLEVDSKLVNNVKELEDEVKAKEIAELQDKKAQAEKIIDEVNNKLKELTK